MSNNQSAKSKKFRGVVYAIIDVSSSRVVSCTTTRPEARWELAKAKLNTSQPLNLKMCRMMFDKWTR